MRQVNMYVDKPSCIELHVREKVRIDRLTPTADGHVAERHGALLAPGVTQVQLDKGRYYFRTLDDAQLRVLTGGVQVTSMPASGKNPWPDPRATDPASRAGLAVAGGEGHGPCGRVPTLRVEYATAGAR